MNISDTNRHAIAIAEAFCRMERTPAPAGSRMYTSFEVEPKSEVLYGRETISPAYNVSYRTIEVTIVRKGTARVVLEITLLKQGEWMWEWAMIECYVVGWVSGSLQYLARNTEQQWTIRELDRFAQAESCGHFDFDYDWCETRAIRAEKAAAEAAAHPA